MTKSEDDYFEIPASLRGVFDSLNPEETGQMITALIDYHFDGEEPNLPPRLDGMYSVLKVVTDKNFQV